MALAPAATADLPANVAALIATIVEESPMHQGFIESALGQVQPDELANLDSYLTFSLHADRSIDYMAQCYLTIVEDTLREQIYFLRHNEYRHKSFADVASDVYFNDDYMDRYMYGLVITSFFWPNHLAMGRFFKEKLPQDKRGNYLEVGPGHGLYLLTAMQRGSFDDYLAVDVSATSVRQTKSIVGHFAPELKERFRIELRDFLAADALEAGSKDAIVMGEVLEHVEEPERFLQRTRELAKPDAFIYVTTCINAPAVDHIYLWRTTEELEQMIRANGLEIVEALRLPYEGKTLQQSVEQNLAINVAYVLKKS